MAHRHAPLEARAIRGQMPQQSAMQRAISSPGNGVARLNQISGIALRGLRGRELRLILAMCQILQTPKGGWRLDVPIETHMNKLQGRRAQNVPRRRHCPEKR